MHETIVRKMAQPVEVSNARVRTDDWPTQATDTIVKVVGTANEKVTGPVTTIARALVFGVFALILGTAALVLVAILFIRVLDTYLPDSVFGKEHVWAAHALTGALFSVFAWILWVKRKPKNSEA